jgi:hypothetical protein
MKTEIEKRNEEDAAAEPEERAEAAGDRAGDEDDQRQCSGDWRDQNLRVWPR